MLRALLIAVLCAALLPAVADARAHTVSVGRGEIVVSYSGSSSVSYPTGSSCHETATCLAFGVVSRTINWDATAIADRNGYIGPDDTTLSAGALYSVRPDDGKPADTGLPDQEPCSATIEDANGEYRLGTSVTTTARSIGVHVVLPYDSRWLRLKNSTDPSRCGFGNDVSAGSIFQLSQYGPTTDNGKEQKALDRASAPQMAIRQSDKTDSKRFDFLYHRTPANLTGPYATTVISIESRLRVFHQCRRFDETHGRCVKYYE